jgi:molybdate transport system substrate-binding protein
MQAPAVLLLLALSCAVPQVARAAPSGLLVFAAASLTDALQEVARGWKDAEVEFSFGASSDLARQIVAGAPADVFFSADVARMDAVQTAKLVKAAERRNVLSNVLVVVVPKETARAPRSAEDLKDVARLALADPAIVPAGVYARRWLEKRGLWAAVRPRAVPTADVRAALAAVETGAADAAVVYRTDAAISKRVHIAFEVTSEEAPQITYVVAPLAASKQGDLARAFVRHLAGPEAAAVFRRFGFIAIDRP